MLSSILFIVLLIAGVGLFTINVRKISRDIKQGKPEKFKDKKKDRWRKVLFVAIGQSKMTRSPVAGLLHVIVYAGFIIVNIEVLEIILDGILNKHRLFAPLGGFYSFLIGAFEVLAILVILACLLFLIRRNILRLKRFHLREMRLWPRTDANIILIVEIFLMSAFLTMNASDSVLQANDVDHYVKAGSFPVSQFIVPLLSGASVSNLIFIERFTWWFHIIGIFAFLNYLPYSKHFHILLSFPNVYYSKLKPPVYVNNMDSVTGEVKLMLNPDADPYAADAGGESMDESSKFGGSDVSELSWKSLMDAYSCTECGRCSDVCPANITGKQLSPRKIMMDTRDRMENKRKNNETDKILLKDYIKPEELWACTTCNACTQECPVNIDQVSIILELRRYLVLEESAAPSPLNSMFTNIENNGAPWQYPPSERAKWTEDIYIKEK